MSLLNKRFNPQGRYFYFDEGDVAQQIIDGHKVFDMYGWVVDEADVAEFEQLWLANPIGRARRTDRRRWTDSAM